MGSFSYSCAVSGLPIEFGDAVVFLALTEEQHSRHGAYEGRWQPVLLPIEGRYNSYGTVDQLTDGPVTDAFFDGLSSRALEREVGANRVHDVVISKGMSRVAWLRALSEGRVQFEDADGAAVEVAQSMVRKDVWDFLATPHSKNIRWFEDSAVRRSLFITMPLGREICEDERLASACRELFQVERSLRQLGRPWARGTCCGPQFGAWAFQLEFLQRLVETATQRIAQYHAEGIDVD